MPAAQVLITHKVLSDWLAECPGHHVDQHSGGIRLPYAPTAQLEAAGTAALAAPPGMQRLRLFSLNDYLGLSTHPDVRRAAAEAALSHGMGESLSRHALAVLDASISALCGQERAPLPSPSLPPASAVRG